MKCPHCSQGIHADFSWLVVGTDKDGTWALRTMRCPECDRLIVILACGEPFFSAMEHTRESFSHLGAIRESRLVRPKGATRPPAPAEATADAPDIAADYAEACLVLADSPKASAALSRRALQHLLREKAGATQRDLAPAIQQVLDNKQLPSYLADDLDAVRNIGNFGAHPLKSTSTGEIIDVEAGEAEWNLDVLEGLFDFYFVQPAIAKKKREGLNKKLQDAGKPPMKT
jgi:hypothetical protein